MNKTRKICGICEKPIHKCECCAECGHICSRDYGEPYCPICFPKPSDDNE